MAEFLTLLGTYGVKALVDVRRHPVSGRYPHFSRDALARSLRRAGIRYLYLGEDLGGFRPGGFEVYMDTPAFAAGLRTLEFAAGRAPTAIMCAERLPSQCHRRFIGAALAQRGWTVLHLIEAGQIWSSADPEPPELPLGETESHE
jgi:uncharacterized protein (DUF488 family)